MAVHHTVHLSYRDVVPHPIRCADVGVNSLHCPFGRHVCHLRVALRQDLPHGPADVRQESDVEGTMALGEDVIGPKIIP